MSAVCEPAPRLGFACVWDPRPERTWSGTPWQLRAALRRRCDLVDVGVTVPRAVREGLRLLYARRRDGRLVSAWKHSRSFERLCKAIIDRGVKRGAVDAVLTIQDLAALDAPFATYQDVSYDVLLRLWDTYPGRGVAHFPMLDRDDIERRRERQHHVYERSATVLAMSRWFARTLVEWSGLPEAKVAVVHPGGVAVAAGGVLRAPVDRPGPRRRLLFVGRDFVTKGGDLVIEALRVLRRDNDPATTLTVVGPATWPLAGPVPDGVRFLGRLPTADVARLYDSHELFVMPSRFEGFGIAFVEALSRGMPCVGRDAFAMPELIRPRENGDLVRGDDPMLLAEVVARTLADDGVYARCATDAAAVAEHFTWGRSADDVLRELGSRLV